MGYQKVKNEETSEKIWRMLLKNELIQPAESRRGKGESRLVYRQNYSICGFKMEAPGEKETKKLPFKQKKTYGFG